MSEPLPSPQRLHPRARLAALALAWAKRGLILLAAITMASLGGGQDPAGLPYLFGGFILGGFYWLVLILPALLLLQRATGHRVGLALSLLIFPDILLALAAAAA